MRLIRVVPQLIYKRESSVPPTSNLQPSNKRQRDEVDDAPSSKRARVLNSGHRAAFSYPIVEEEEKSENETKNEHEPEPGSENVGFGSGNQSEIESENESDERSQSEEVSKIRQEPPTRRTQHEPQLPSGHGQLDNDMSAVSTRNASPQVPVEEEEDKNESESGSDSGSEKEQGSDDDTDLQDIHPTPMEAQNHLQDEHRRVAICRPRAASEQSMDTSSVNNNDGSEDDPVKYLGVRSPQPVVESESESDSEDEVEIEQEQDSDANHRGILEDIQLDLTRRVQSRTPQADHTPPQPSVVKKVDEENDGDSDSLSDSSSSSYASAPEDKGTEKHKGADVEPVMLPSSPQLHIASTPPIPDSSVLTPSRLNPPARATLRTESSRLSRHKPNPPVRGTPLSNTSQAVRPSPPVTERSQSIRSSPKTVRQTPIPVPNNSSRTPRPIQSATNLAKAQRATPQTTTGFKGIREQLAEVNARPQPRELVSTPTVERTKQAATPKSVPWIPGQSDDDDESESSDGDSDSD
jgi:hypothetical protein